jgi:hypothetical protein
MTAAGVQRCALLGHTRIQDYATQSLVTFSCAAVMVGAWLVPQDRNEHQSRTTRGRINVVIQFETVILEIYFNEVQCL